MANLRALGACFLMYAGVCILCLGLVAGAFLLGQATERASEIRAAAALNAEAHR